MQLTALAVVGLAALAKADQCSPQIWPGSNACEYTTSCLSGNIQWMRPTDDCQWTFVRDGASALELSADWFTGLVNLTFYDGKGPHAKVLGFVDNKQSHPSVHVTSNTGMIFVKLHAASFLPLLPPSAPEDALALKFNFQLKDECSIHGSDCKKCVTAGCGMVYGGGCVPDCPAEKPCWADAGFGVDDACSAYQGAVDKGTLCHSKSDCKSCLATECHWDKKGNRCVSLSDCNSPDQPCNLADTCEISKRVKGPQNRPLSSILKRLR